MTLPPMAVEVVTEHAIRELGALAAAGGAAIYAPLLYISLVIIYSKHIVGVIISLPPGARRANAAVQHPPRPAREAARGRGARAARPTEAQARPPVHATPRAGALIASFCAAAFGPMHRDSPYEAGNGWAGDNRAALASQRIPDGHLLFVFCSGILLVLYLTLTLYFAPYEFGVPAGSPGARRRARACAAPLRCAAAPP